MKAIYINISTDSLLSLYKSKVGAAKFAKDRGQLTFFLNCDNVTCL